MNSLAPDSRDALSAAYLDQWLLALIRGEWPNPGDSSSAISASLCRALLDRSRMHGARVLVSNALSGHTQDEAVKTDIMQAQMGVVARDIRMAHQAVNVARSFEDAGIRVQLMKGPLLWRALQLAGPSKASSDIDLLVAPADVEGADRVLGQLGYKCVGIDPNETTYSCPGQASIDLHWSIIRWVDQSPDFWLRLWDNRAIVSMEGTRVPTLSPTHTTLALLLHAGCHHLCTDWASLHDIAQCTRVWQHSMDWQEMVDLADRAGRRCALYPPLALASQHFSACVPDDILRAVKPRLHRRGMIAIARRGFEARLTSGSSYDNAKRLWNLLSQADTRQVISLLTGWAKNRAKQTKARSAAGSAVEDHN